jgi:predicted Fe-S protein YdhL (DUF1289 family)
MMATKLPSPCISICQIDPTQDLCLGCYRTRDEIASWSRLSEGEQRQLINELQDRRAKATGRVRRRSRRIAS